MQLPHFLLFKFGAANVVERLSPRAEGIISAYEFEFYTEDCPGGTLTDGKFRSARKGQYNLYRPGQRQQLVPPYKCYFMNITTQDPELCDFLDRLPESGPIWNLDAVVDLLREMMATQEKSALEGRLWLESCACRILSLLAAQRLACEPQKEGAFLHCKELMEANRYIRGHLTEDISLKKLAQMSNLDPTYFHKLYTSTYGKTPAQHLLAYRITAAKMALAEGELSVSEIAAQCGFSSQSYFSTRFRQATGRTPSQYRKILMQRPKK